MSASPSQMHEDDPVDQCDVCDDHQSDLFFCQPCKCTFCFNCWQAQAAHNPKRAANIRSGAIPHEKIQLSVIRLVQPAFSTPEDEATIEKRLADDDDSAWFGVNRELGKDGPLYLRDHGRYADLMMPRSALSPFIRDSIAESGDLPARRTPSLVSFVGQTGVGKSTLIKLLIQLKALPGSIKIQCPVVGVPGREVPTSEDVHLYIDPATYHSDVPALYADCEGLDGGEREPLASMFRSSRNFSQRELEWVKTKADRTRHFAVSSFYPRLLFTFSDVIVFVHRDPRIIESVLERLIEWASAALETACNQPILPHAIVVLNVSPNNIDSRLWDVDIATKTILESLATIVNENVTFAKYAKSWRERGREVNTVEQLMMCYYSSVKIVRLPTDSQTNLVHTQAQKLYAEIQRDCHSAREKKSALRMLLDAEGFQNYLQHAFDHYSQTLEVPFDFVQASFLHNPIPLNFGGSILKLAIAMSKQEKRPDARAIFARLGNLVASCIMLDAVRHDVLGTSDHIFPQYLEHLDAALRDFCDRHWPCEYVMRGVIPAHLQSHLSTLQFQQNMRASALLYRCVNMRCGHESKGHQLHDGRTFARGRYVAKFSFENNRDEFRAGVYFRLEYLLNQLDNCIERGEAQEAAATRLHRINLLEFFCGPGQNLEAINLRNHTVCWCCLFEVPEHALSCGHILCTPCVKAYGRPMGRMIVQIHECPFESYGRCQSRPIYIKPEEAGIRILVLDDGGVRGLIQVEILRLLERELNGKIPVQLFFDMIVARGSSSIIALGLLNNDWNLEECSANFIKIWQDSCASSNRRRSPRLTYPACKYRSSGLVESLQKVFGETRPLFGDSKLNTRFGTNTKVIIPTLSASGRTMVFSNFRRQIVTKAPYDMHRPDDANEEMKVWEVVRTAMANPLLFKPFTDSQSFRNKASKELSLYVIAGAEMKAVWEMAPLTFPDILVSLGTGLDAEPDSRSITSKKSRGGAVGRKEKEPATPSSDQRCEDTWNRYVEALPAKDVPISNFVRLNITIPALPSIDAVEKLEYLRNHVRTHLDPDSITKLVSQLVARFFYFEKSNGLGASSEAGLLIQGEILCRLPDGAPEICELGKLLREGSRFTKSIFVFRESECQPHIFPIPGTVTDTMALEMRFKMPIIEILISPKRGTVDAVLQLANNEEYTISGFPRPLVDKISQGRRQSHARCNSYGTTTAIRRRPEWTPPDLSRFPSFDSAVQLDAESTAVNPNRLLAAHELPTRETRGSTEIREAMVFQRERDKVRMEEVRPLEERVRRLETLLAAGGRIEDDKVPGAQVAGNPHDGSGTGNETGAETLSGRRPVGSGSASGSGTGLGSAVSRAHTIRPEPSKIGSIARKPVGSE